MQRSKNVNPYACNGHEPHNASPDKQTGRKRHKTCQKISNCFRTFRVAEIYARIGGFVSTARKNSRPIYSELCTTFEEYNFITV